MYISLEIADLHCQWTYFNQISSVWNFPHKITESELLFVCFVSGVLREMLNLLRVTLSKFNFSLRNPRIKQTNKSSDSVILCGKFQTALSGGNKSTDSGGQQSLKILSYKSMPLNFKNLLS